MISSDAQLHLENGGTAPSSVVGTSPRRLARKIIVAVVGGTVLIFGIALIVLPGPAVVVIPAGLAILASEFLWARRLLRPMKRGALGAREIVTRLFGHMRHREPF
jgi:putative transmembrane protein PGPGW